MKVYLKTYSQEAETILHRAAIWYLNPQPSKRSYFKREADNELVFIDECSNTSAATFKRRLGRALTDYKIEIQYEAASKTENARKVECMKLIVLEKDKKAKKSYPDEYAALKGKQLDPIKAAAVEVLAKEIEKRLREADERALALPRDVFNDEWVKLKEEISELNFKLNELRCFPTSKEDS